ncbi:hypothetical protein [Vibrio sp. OPT20]|uniref:hypothetical protein n=1 Tax=Vibrio sp. OPT20 TaxID=2778642 RepID=UPI001D13AF5E|nr:hypothetical protein [Vibrio sp. OPT20]
MHLVCKFISSSSLSTNDLQYVLTPDECIGLFSRVRTPKDILAQLPSTLLHQITASAKKNAHSLLYAIRVELVKANWVCLSSNVRRSLLTTQQLASFPRLKLHVDRVANNSSDRVHKANYQQVVDDVPLARHYSFSPVEPSPEHKIVVEFAGQWSSNAACLMLGKTEAQKEKVTVGKADTGNKHRSLATFKDLEAEGKTLYIKIPCSDQPQPILLKLTEGLQPVDKENHMDEWDNVLVPVLPMLEGTNGHELVSDGYFYVIWNNKVWREVEVTPKGYFADVDLEYYRNNDPESSMKTRHVNIDGANLVPDYYVGEEAFEIYQSGQKVYSGHLSLDQGARVFRLLDEEVDVVFPELDIDPITVKTVLSPYKASKDGARIAQGVPLPHIWVPYKVAGGVQECYIHYSELALRNTELSELESDPASIAKSLSDLQIYSSSQSFDNAGENIIPVSGTASTGIGSGIINEHKESNVAGLKLAPRGALPSIRYLHEPLTDQPDDFFGLRNIEHDWIHKSYFRSAMKDDDGYMTLRFAFPPEEVKSVDIVRGVHSSLSTGSQRLVVVEENVPISELLG